MRQNRAEIGPDLTVVFRREVGPIFSYLLVRCGSRSTAEDLTSETFAAAIKRFDAGCGDEVTPAWLRTVAKRRLIDHWRSLASRDRSMVRLAGLAMTPPAPPSDPDDDIDRALSSLPERQRAALVLRYMDDFSTSEVATALDVTYKAAESLLSRARANFQAAYEATE